MRTMDAIAAGFALAALGSCSGPEVTFTDLVPIISVNPTELAFGTVGFAEGVSATLPIFISNAGKKDLEVSSISLTGATAPFTLDATELVVAPGEDTQVNLTFVPTGYFDFEARVLIESNDEENKRVVVPVSGKGGDVPLPDIVITPGRTIAFDDVIPYGGLAQELFTIENRGDEVLNVGDITLEDMGAAVFELASTPDNSIIAPGGSASVLVQYGPDDEEGDLSVVHIASDDPDTPDMTVQLVGNGGGPFYEDPVAVINCPDQVPLTGPEYIRLDGSNSYDPGDPEGLEPLRYQWNYLFRPPASDSNPIDPDDAPQADVHVDVAGDWIVSLIVTNAYDAQSEPTTCEFDAIPEDNIHVELQWDTPSADMDLHLVQGGWSLFDVPEDCYYCNTNPDWGVENEDDDDPRLDIDDRAGYGPENINILAPFDGTYDVRVHYWQQNGDEAVAATVHVWVDGVEAFSDSQIMTRNQVWEVGTINWDGANNDFLPGITSPYDAGARGCP